MELEKYLQEEFTKIHNRLDGFAREIKAIRDNQPSRQEISAMLNSVETSKTATDRMMAEFHLLANAMNRLDPDYTPLPPKNPNPKKGDLGKKFSERNKE